MKAQGMKNKKLILAVIAAVAILAIVAIPGVIWYCSSGVSNNETSEQEASTSPANTYTVTFYSDDGTVLKIASVSENTAAVPPNEPVMSCGAVFKCWDKDFTCVNQDLDIYPVCENLNGKANVFAIEGAYGKIDSTVVLPVRLCGDVCVSGFDIIIRYDSERLELQSVSEDGAVVYNSGTPGEIRINYVSVENTLGDVDICDLKFVVKTESGVVPVVIETKSIYACKDTLESMDDSLYIPDYCVIDGAVFVIP